MNTWLSSAGQFRRIEAVLSMCETDIRTVIVSYVLNMYLGFSYLRDEKIGGSEYFDWAWDIRISSIELNYV